MKLTRRRKQATIILSDALSVLLSASLSVYLIKFYVHNNLFQYVTIASIYLLVYLLVSFKQHSFSGIIRFFNFSDARQLVLGNVIAGVIAFICGTMVFSRVSNRYSFLLLFFSTAFMLLARMLWRTYVDEKNHVRSKSDNNAPRLLLVGAGDAGNLFIESFAKAGDRFTIVGLVDDDPNKQGVYLRGYPVLGPIDQIPQIIDAKRVDQITITAPSLPSEKVEEVIRLANEKDISVKQMPEVERVMAGDLQVAMRDIEINDLLGREEVELDDQAAIDTIGGKTILVTGAGGSIGSEICRQLLKFGPAKLLLLGHGENSIYLIDRELNQLNQSGVQIVPIIADIQDRDHINDLVKFYQPNIIYHAAAHKHVPLMEYNPTEAVKNNIYGTYNVARAAEENGVERFVMISTDKANNPPNVMGATKRIAEMIVTGLNENSQCTFSAVRFGNVLGSRGSVIPLFKKQIAAGGPVTVTHPDMRRYFMTIPEASRLVIQASSLAEGGELFILNMGKEVYIKDLARKMITLSGYSEDEIEIKYVGMRPGEKLYETLLLDDETTDRQVDDKIFVGKVHNKSLKEIRSFVEGLDLSGHDDKLSEKLTTFVHRNVEVE
ncbi:MULTISPECIES: polysaccharide biosynthesis protein [Aerococcus]|uniref:polysaccharide biosynthesis protein n=1 Tax=Aerococcus urinae (strain CCUG 59500 / ACS-120-V-Col10a) TaxID=2976812 RepID=UPI000200E703|nr:nucleoside-diphosphate sugar epimerase/dehydratase [Aerococcus sp. Group 1]AEA01694.1 polysaccharide biosynthesis protein [Aerococcus sp. Group 1]MCY3030588.1 polysaccharide biosynthesis protein [Aerococcus sp. Group 1]MCY3054741.1 polysaccharide biosynthesis protein [Aerococcus sp. Group 1]MCY3056471.1 polysaccharide biosynthesis protein [Aerococcus sp. Group 1]MCY3061271.1 polysaccharide biosynthesis protein [Aerococcus sp. Group 1]